MANDPARPRDPAEVVTESNPKVTYSAVFADREYRALFLSTLINWIGDYLSRAAVTVLVYHQTQSALLSAASFAIGYVPWLFGPVLAAFAERHPYRRVMIVSDLSRMVLISLLLLPQLPVPAMLLILLVAGMFAPPTQAARSALLPTVVGRERLALALTISQTASQTAQVFGYLVGATVAVALTPRIALGVDVLTFALSAALIAFGVRHRPTTMSSAQRTHLLHETAEGFRLVFGHPVLRSIAVVVFTITVFAIVPEGLAAAWAADITTDPETRGLGQGLIMAAGPVGFIIGGTVFNRIVPAERRARLIPVLAVLPPLLLVPSLLAPAAPAAALMVLSGGLVQGALTPTLNAVFVLALPHGFRARAFGVMSSGIQISQLAAVLTTGSLAEHFRVPMVVGLWSAGGAVAMLFLAFFWPAPAAFARATADAAATMPDEEKPAAPPVRQPGPADADTGSGTVPTTSVTPERS
ncbi:MFS transporter [Actinoplanes sp. NBRC 101535]|uniref:MFS transporter n=1 Tax=Actinoplanes sp. NBRC 101535 TaxID=3032196 RepID=UPI0024A424C5|nr:MFS transporter [Actinoplanes sp. NBRC 101535]GLY01424.1 MFS transporter [Actinoplanes sp. NBRC 101535]